MNFIIKWWNRLIASHIQSEIDEELGFHLELLARRYETEGLDRRSARKRALRRFGSFERTRNACSSVYGLSSSQTANRGTIMQNLLQDIRYALHTLRRQPVFSLVAILTLAVGIAASTTMFSAVNSTVLNPVPFEGGNRMARAWHVSPSGGMRIAPASPTINVWRTRASTVSDVATWGSEAMVLRMNGEPERVIAAAASVQLLSFLGLQPILGRAFQSADTIPGQDRVVMLTDRYWRQQYGRNPDVLGQTLTLNDEPYVIIGVTPPLLEAFFPADRSSDTDYSVVIPAVNKQATYVKIRPDVTLAEAETELVRLFEQVEGEIGTPRSWPVELRRPAESVSSSLRVGLWVLLGAVGFLLLVACINVANMLLIRGVTRSHELALRQSLGAGTARMMRQLLVESLLITTAATGVALWLTFSVLRLLRAHAPEGLEALRNVRFDWPVLASAIGITVLITVAFGMVPLGQLRTVNLTQLFSTGRAGHSTPTRSGLRSALVALEVAMATVLFVGAGLMTRTLSRLAQHDPGFQATNVVTFRVELPEERYPTTTARETFVRDARERLASIPGVEGAAAGGIGVIGASEAALEIAGTGEPAPSRLLMMNLVSDGFFQTLGMRIRGRDFLPGETVKEAPDVVVVNEAFERVYLSGESAIGKQFRTGDGDDWTTIIGVVPNVHLSGMNVDADWIQIYMPFNQWNLSGRPFVVRTVGDPSNAVSLIKAAIWTLDDRMIPYDFEIATEMLSDAIARPRFTAILMSSFAFVGLLLAAVGVYTVVSMAQQHRRHEVGVRVALGADIQHTFRLMLSYGMKPVFVGAAGGLVAAALLSRFVQTLLFEVERLDPLTYGAVVLTIVVTALAASILPARKALRVDPVEVLRYQ